MKRLEETHKVGAVFVENLNVHFHDRLPDTDTLGKEEADLSIQISEEGLVWINLNGISLLRFRPKVLAHW